MKRLFIFLFILFFISGCEEVDTFEEVIYENNKSEEILERVFIEERIVNVLNERFEKQTVEFNYCLNGSKVNNNYYITFYRIAKLVNATNMSFFGEYCDNNPGSIHNHIDGNCNLSKKDREWFTELYLEHNHKLMAVICGEDKIAFYNFLDFRKPLYLGII